MNVHFDAISQSMDQSTDTSGNPGCVGKTGISGSAEFIEVAARAETITGTIEHSTLEAVIVRQQLQSFTKRITHGSRISVALVRPVQGESQFAVVDRYQNCGCLWFYNLPALFARRQPGLILGAVLQGRIGERLREQAIRPFAARGTPYIRRLSAPGRPRCG